ncbi:hypothetical protein R3Q06_29460 [Rhodococcus erythropolis]|uniref:hypothetical protein n=1 Tax=Rhodococcus erythropolis TaxID=1833 RepID=UPI0029491F82|nr:hypothetical protein [Rhodococcus erythropolis]MDV6277624.1 hypothetical protein [Rhodococcus erythropolis]
MRVKAMVGTGAMAVALAAGPVATASAEGAETAGPEGSPGMLTCEVVFDALEDMSPEWTEEGIDQVEDWCEAITGEED